MEDGRDDVTRRGGIVTGRSGTGSTDASDARAKSGDDWAASPADVTAESPRPVRWLLVLAGVAVVAVVLALLPYRTQIPPIVSSDHCYLLLAADRLHDGHGLRSLPPVAPLQPWTWRADWAFLTKWPPGYPLLVCALRRVSGLATVQACQWISVVACAAALVGWFTWVRRAVPRGVTGVLLGAVAAGCSISTAMLLNPSTDLLLIALMPYVLLLTVRAVERVTAKVESVAAKGFPWDRFLWVGLIAGTLLWIRYAAIFVPVAIGLYLLLEPRLRRAGGLRPVIVFVFGAATPIASLLLIGRALGLAESGPAQLNLGHSIGWDFSLALITEAWWRLTDLGFYDYHRFTHLVYAIWPAALLITTLCIPSARRAVGRSLANPAVGLSAVVVLCLLGMLVGATALFGEKFNYIGLDRYYLPGRPLYFLLFATPVLLIRMKTVRVIACVAMLVACSWIVQQDWARSYDRRLADGRERTPAGWAATCFTPNAGELYHWLSDQAGPELIVVSNFHEWIALETRIPALPIPPDVDTLDDWINRICVSRDVTHPRVLFILNSDNGYRDYWIPEPSKVIKTFALSTIEDSPTGPSASAFRYTSPHVSSLADLGL